MGWPAYAGLKEKKKTTEQKRKISKYILLLSMTVFHTRMGRAQNARCCGCMFPAVTGDVDCSYLSLLAFTKTHNCRLISQNVTADSSHWQLVCRQTASSMKRCMSVPFASRRCLQILSVLLRRWDGASKNCAQFVP